MEIAKMKTYRQSRPSEWLKRNPKERWRCDIFPDDGSDHHGVGATRGEAIFNAASAYSIWADRRV